MNLLSFSMKRCLLVDQVVGGRYVVVPIGFHAADGVLLFELVVVQEALEQFTIPGHFLEAWVKTGLAGNRVNAPQVFAHVNVVTNI